MMNTKRRQMLWGVSKEALIGIVFYMADGLTLSLVNGIPESTKVVDVRWDWRTNCLYFVLEDPSFPETADGCQLLVIDSVSFDCVKLPKEYALQAALWFRKKGMTVRYKEEDHL